MHVVKFPGNTEPLDYFRSEAGDSVFLINEGMYLCHNPADHITNPHRCEILRFQTQIIFMNVPATDTTIRLHQACWLSGNVPSFDKCPVLMLFCLPTVVVTCVTTGM